MSEKEKLTLAIATIEKELHLLKKEGVIQEKGYISRLGNELIIALNKVASGREEVEL